MKTNNTREQDFNFPTARTEALIVRELDGETLIYDERTHKAYCLNETARLIWQACDGRTDVAGIKRQLERTSDAPIADEVVWLGLDQLSKQNLLRSTPARANSNAPAMSRRAVMKTLGISAAVALPVVTAILAPTAAQAVTGGAGGANCMTNSDCTAPMTCQSGTCV